MSVLIFTGDRNKEGKRDYTGAFKPEAEAFASFCRTIPANAYICKIGLAAKRGIMRKEVLEAIEEYKPEVIAFFCHGTAKSIQLGFDTSNIAEIVKPGVKKVILYACSTAAKPRGGSSLLEALPLSESLQSYGHTTVGHTTRNPFVMRNWNRVEYIVPPGHALWKHWVAWMRRGSNRFRFPFMYIQDIYKEVETGSDVDGGQFKWSK